MVHPCIVSGCKNKAKDGIYRFPRDIELRKAWLKSINCDDTLDPDDENHLANAESYRICGLHFKPTDFKRDLKGELLGVPSKRKVLLPGSVPSIEKHDRPKYQTRSKPRQRSQLANSVFANTEIYEEIGIDGPFIAYGSPLTIAKTNIKGRKKAENSERMVSHKNLRRTVSVNKLLLRHDSILNNSVLHQVALSGNPFTVKKSQIIAKIKKEAEENVLKEKVLASINMQSSSTEAEGERTVSGKVRRLPPQQCVILKPVPKLNPSDPDQNSEEPNEPPPIIIPGNPEKSMKLLQNPEGRDLIQKEIEKHYEQRVPIEDDSRSNTDDPTTLNENRESTTAIILSTISSLDETDTEPGKIEENKALNEKDETSIATTSIRSLPPLRMKPETNSLRLNIPHEVSEVNIKRKRSWASSDGLSNKILVSSVNNKHLGKLQTIPSRKCTVLDLLFDREDQLEEDLPDPVENVPLPEPVPDDSQLSVILFKNNKSVSSNDIPSNEQSEKEIIKSNEKQYRGNTKYAIFDPSGLKSELDKYKDEVKDLRKENYSLKIKVQTLRNEKNKLSKKVDVREKLMETRKRKSKKDLETISKLRTELSKLRQLRNKMRRREYNRKAKHEKVLERRKKRRQFIQQQIELGVMDKSQLSLVYSRKKLPYERKHGEQHVPGTHKQGKNPSTIETKDRYHQIPINMNIIDPQSNPHIFPTPTVEYIIEHDGQIQTNQLEEETVVEVDNYYESLANDNVVSEQETHAAVAGISGNDSYHQVMEHPSNSETVIPITSSSYETAYVTVANEHRYTISSSQKGSPKPVQIIQLQSSSKGNTINSASSKANVEECSAEHLDFIVKAVNELENSNPGLRLPSTTHSSISTIPSSINTYRPISMQRRPATFVVLAPSSTSKQKHSEGDNQSSIKTSVEKNMSSD